MNWRWGAYKPPTSFFQMFAVRLMDLSFSLSFGPGNQVQKNPRGRRSLWKGCSVDLHKRECRGSSWFATSNHRKRHLITKLLKMLSWPLAETMTPAVALSFWNLLMISGENVWNLLMISGENVTLQQNALHIAILSATRKSNSELFWRSNPPWC